ncbi:DsbA family protein [Maritalea myrionectae]|nr:DsbA family protein [Maritalea myrionectae]
MKTIQSFMGASLVGLTLCLSSNAQELSDFDAQVRDTLLRNPSIILEVFAKLEAEEELQKAKADLKLIEGAEADLFADVSSDEPILIEFLDYNCGYCQRAHGELLRLREAAPNVKIVYKQFPILGDESRKLSELMTAFSHIASEGDFEHAHTKLMTGDREIRSDLVSFFEEYGVSYDELVKLSKSDLVQNEIQNNYSLARSLNISGTPGFVSRKAIVRGYADAVRLKEISEPVTE